MVSLCHPWFTTTNLSYRFPIFETSATALCGTTGIECQHEKPLWIDSKFAAHLFYSMSTGTLGTPEPPMVKQTMTWQELAFTFRCNNDPQFVWDPWHWIFVWNPKSCWCELLQVVRIISDLFDKFDASWRQNPRGGEPLPLKTMLMMVVTILTIIASLPLSIVVFWLMSDKEVMFGAGWHP